jgi:hypothetical protein
LLLPALTVCCTSFGLERSVAADGGSCPLFEIFADSVGDENGGCDFKTSLLPLPPKVFFDAVVDGDGEDVGSDVADGDGKRRYDPPPLVLDDGEMLEGAGEDGNGDKEGKADVLPPLPPRSALRPAAELLARAASVPPCLAP